MQAATSEYTSGAKPAVSRSVAATPCTYQSMSAAAPLIGEKIVCLAVSSSSVYRLTNGIHSTSEQLNLSCAEEQRILNNVLIDLSSQGLLWQVFLHAVYSFSCCMCQRTIFCLQSFPGLSSQATPAKVQPKDVVLCQICPCA